MIGTWTKLPGADWALRVRGAAKPGDVVTAQRKDGSTSHVIVVRVLCGGVEPLCEVAELRLPDDGASRLGMSRQRNLARNRRARIERKTERILERRELRKTLADKQVARDAAVKERIIFALAGGTALSVRDLTSVARRDSSALRRHLIDLERDGTIASEPGGANPVNGREYVVYRFVQKP